MGVHDTATPPTVQVTLNVRVDPILTVLSDGERTITLAPEGVVPPVVPPGVVPGIVPPVVPPGVVPPVPGEGSVLGSTVTSRELRVVPAVLEHS